MALAITSPLCKSQESQISHIIAATVLQEVAVGDKAATGEAKETKK